MFQMLFSWAFRNASSVQVTAGCVRWRLAADSRLGSANLIQTQPGRFATTSAGDNFIFGYDVDQRACAHAVSLLAKQQAAAFA